MIALAAESIGWLPLGEGAYLHMGKPDEAVITVVGVGKLRDTHFNSPVFT